MTATQHQIGCYWWATSKPSLLNTECDAPASAMKTVAEWPRSGTNCQFCGKVMAYSNSREEAEHLHKTGADITWKHKA